MGAKTCRISSAIASLDDVSFHAHRRRSRYGTVASGAPVLASCAPSPPKMPPIFSVRVLDGTGMKLALTVGATGEDIRLPYYFAMDYKWGVAGADGTEAEFKNGIKRRMRSPDSVEAERPGEGWIVVPDGGSVKLPNTISLPYHMGEGRHGFQGIASLQHPFRYTLKGQEVIVIQDAETVPNVAGGSKTDGQ